MNGEDAGTNIVSRSVAKDESYQLFSSNIEGNAKCSGHTECDAIIVGNARISAVPEITANDSDAGADPVGLLERSQGSRSSN